MRHARRFNQTEIVESSLWKVLRFTPGAGSRLIGGA